MDKEGLATLLIILLTILLTIYVVAINTSAANKETYQDDFNDSIYKWEQVKGKWNKTNNELTSKGNRFSTIIFNSWKGKRYIFKSKFYSNDNVIDHMAQIGFYFHYKNGSHYGQVYFKDDERDGKKDQFKVESKGITVVGKKYLPATTDNLFTINSNKLRQIKIIRLGPKIFTYYDNRIIYTAKLKGSNPEGRVGYDVYASTGYFDDFYLEPITLQNASVYEDEVSLESGGSWSIDDVYSVSLREVVDGKALVVLERFGESVGRTVVEKGDSAALSDGDGEDYVEFSVDEVFDTDGGSGKVWLKDVISREAVPPGLSVQGFQVDSGVKEGGNVSVDAEVVNGGNSTISGKMSYSFSLGGESVDGSREVSLDLGESEALRFNVSAPDRFGSYTGTLDVELQGQSLSEKGSVDVVTERPPVTDLRVKGSGGRGFTVEAVPGTKGRFIDWGLPYTLKLYRLTEQGREEVYVEEGFFQSRSREFTLDEARGVGLGSGYFEAVVNAGGKEAVHVLGDGFTATGGAGTGSEAGDSPAKGSREGTVPGSVLVLALLGLVAVNGVKTRAHGHRNLPVEAVLIGGGALGSVVLFLQGPEGSFVQGLAVLLTGVFVAAARRGDERVDELLDGGDGLSDYAALVAAFAAAAAVLVNIGEPVYGLVVPLVYGAAVSAWVRLDRG